MAMTSHANGRWDSDYGPQFYYEVGAKIRQVRKERGMKQETLAEGIGLTRTSLTNIEKGRQRLLLHMFIHIAASLGVEPNALLPTGTATLEKLGIQLPESMKPEKRDFITRAMSPTVTHENRHTSPPARSDKTPSRAKRNSRAAD